MPRRRTPLLALALTIGPGARLGSEEPTHLIPYELTSASRLSSWSPPDPSVEAELIGTFTLSLRQTLSRVSGTIQDISFTDPAEVLFRVTGGGWYLESADTRRSPTARPPNTSNYRLDVSINDVDDVHLYADLPVNPLTFPSIVLGGFRDGVFNHPERSFWMSLVARPRGDALRGFFRRGDVTGDGRRDITDAVSLLEDLFAGAGAPTCWDAADANDDSQVDLADAVLILSHLFRGNGPLPLPSTFCGVDETPDALGCNGQLDCGASP